MSKPLSTVELAAGLLGLAKTATVVLVMVLLEWARLRERKAQLATAGAENDLAVLKSQVEASHDKRPAQAVVDDYLRAHAPGGDEPG